MKDRITYCFLLAALLLPLDAAVAKSSQLKLPLARFGRRGRIQEADQQDVTSAGDHPEREDQELANDDDEKATDDTTSEEHSSPDDDNNNDDATTNPNQSSSEPQATNQTRSAILFVPPAPHQHQPMRPGFPLHPYHVPSPTRKRPSLLSTILMAFFPSTPPSNVPPSPFPPSPFGPPQTPNKPTILPLLLRLTLLTLTTHILDLFGLGTRDAFLPSPAQHYTFERINHRYRRDGNALSMALTSPPPGVGKYHWKRILARKRRMVIHSLNNHIENATTTTTDGQWFDATATIQNGALYNRTVILIDIKPDGRVGNGMAEHLRDTVSFIIEQHRDHFDRRQSRWKQQYIPGSSSSTTTRTEKGIRSAMGTDLEVVVLLDSPGGTVSDYGLAASHLARLRDEPHITLSVCVDRVAASGGYMMASQATPGRLFAAPFAMVGSIGVLMETVNFNDILNRYGVKPLTIQAGKHKAPLKSLGEVTQEEMDHAQKDANEIHEAFRRLIVSSRPNVVASNEWLEKVCTGSVFLGKEAVELGLVDAVKTSDEYVAERIAAGDRVLRLIPYKGPQMFALKLSPLDLLLSGMDAEGRAKIREVLSGARGFVASLCRVGGAVGILNAIHYFATVGRCPHLFLGT